MRVHFLLPHQPLLELIRASNKIIELFLEAGSQFLFLNLTILLFHLLNAIHPMVLVHIILILEWLKFNRELIKVRRIHEDQIIIHVHKN